ncbi:glycosyltransferase family 1 protein [Buttiauxella warmboldiae]|uniref:Glycosyltransferase family 1 protein n=1 Tax=Buttiauxella warmboldiae TaxID=82993 RepID=A0A3N5DR65_9ENTR|nr:DUF1972 domain-containing protein [Buttiauxella warmboldiae]RPH28130.1 glycosyltransferase family 1 protein [Buttiauxella warmboldiae]
MKKIAVIGTVGLPACYGGFETLVENLTNDSSDELEYFVFCSQQHYDLKKDTHNGAALIYLPLSANNYQSIFYDIYSLIQCINLKPDVTLVLGVSGCIFIPVYKLFSKSKVIVNIDGLEWRRNKWGKMARFFLKLSERIAVRFGDVIITDNQAITDYVKKEYSKHSETIAYGGDHIGSFIPTRYEDNDCYLSICRIEPENNVHIILEAFSICNKKIVFIGNWENSSYGRALKSKYGAYKNITILDPIYDILTLHDIRQNCIGYIHGHSAGGTNPSLVEAMSSNKAVIAFDCIFNRFTMDNEGAYFESAEQLVLILESQNVNSLANNAAKMNEIAQKKYKWEHIVRQYEHLYYD